MIDTTPSQIPPKPRPPAMPSTILGENPIIRIPREREREREREGGSFGKKHLSCRTFD